MPDVGELFVRIRPAPGTQAAITSEASGPVAAAGRDLSKVFLAAFAIGGIATTIKGVVTAATEHQSAFAVLSQTTKDAGASNTIYGQTIESLLEKEARLKGFSDESLASSFVRLVSATKNSAQAFKDLGLAEDVARARHIDLANAALAISKAEQGSATALQRLGVVVHPVAAAVDALKVAHENAIISGAKFTDQQKQVYAQALLTAAAQDKEATRLEVLSTLQQRFGGDAAKFANTASGQFARLQADFHQFEVTIGTDVLPALSSAAEGLGAFFTQAKADPGVQQAFATIGRDARTVLTDIKDVATTVGPPLLSVAKAAEEVASAVGAPAILTAIAAYKAFGIVQGGVTAAQALYARVAGTSTAATVAKTAATGTDAAAVSALTAALVANTAALEANDAVAAESVVIYGALGEELATVTVAAEALAVSETEVGAAGSFGALALGVGSLINPATAAVIGVALLAGGIAFLATRESATTQATHGLESAVRSLALVEQSLPSDRLTVAEDKLAIKRDQNAIATSKLTHSSLEYQQLLLNLANDSLNLESAQQTLRDGLAKTAAAFDDEKIKAQALAAAANQASTLEPFSGRGAGRQIAPADQSQVQRTEAATQFAKGIQATIDSGEKLTVVQRHNLDLLEQWAQVYGKVPTNKQINLILNSRSADISLDAIRRKIEGLPAISGPAAAAAATEITHRFNAATLAAAAQFSLGPSISRAFSLLPAQVGPAATASGFDVWSKTSQGILDAAAATGIPGLTDVVQAQLDAIAANAGANATAAGSALGSDLLTGFAAQVFPGFNSIITQINAEISAGKKAAAEKQLNITIDPLKQTIASDQADLTNLAQQAQDTAAQGAQALADAVNQAKQNLNSIGQSIAQSLFTFIDQPLQRAAQRIQDAQQKMSLLGDKQSLARLGEEVILPGNQRLSADPSKAIAQLERLQKERKSPALDAYVLQFRSLALQVEGDKNAVKQSAADLVKTAAESRLANLTDLFNTHRISQATLERDVTALLEHSGLTARTARTRGAAFADTLSGELTGLKQQAGALATGPNQPGSGLIPSIVRPIDTLNATQKSLAGIASQERSKQLSETKTHTELLKKIHSSQVAAGFTSSLDHNPGVKTKQSKDLVGAGG